MIRNRQQGYTLIEIMLAVAIVAILAAIAIQAYEGHIGEARIGTAVKDIRQAEVMLNDLAADASLGQLDGNSGAVRGLYLNNGTLVLGSPSTTPSGSVPWLDPWGRIYRYQRANTNSGVRTDAGGNVSNNAANNTMATQSYDLFSQGADTAITTDDVVRGCNGSFVGLDSDHPSCP